MKKITYLAFLLLVALLLVACSSNEESTSKETEVNESQENETENEGEGINVDKGLFNVEITLPDVFFEGEDIDSVIANAEEDGMEVTKNEDGSLTYKVSKAKHEELMNELETSITESVEDMINSEDYISIKDITYNKKFSEFTLLVDKNAYENSFDGFAVLGLGMSGAMYQLFNGADIDNYNVKIIVKDESTQEVIAEANYPEDLENFGE